MIPPYRPSKLGHDLREFLSRKTPAEPLPAPPTASELAQRAEEERISKLPDAYTGEWSTAELDEKILTSQEGKLPSRQASIEVNAIAAEIEQIDLTLSDIAQYPEDYVEEVKFETLNDVEQRKYLYDPKPEVFE